MKSRLIETLLGGIVLIVGVYFLIFAWQATNTEGSHQTIELVGDFSSIGNLVVGAPIKIGGYTIGKVENLSINPTTYLVRVTMDVNKKIEIPKDSTFSISSAGLISRNTITVMIGSSPIVLKNKDKINHIKNAYGLEDVVASFING